MADRMGLLLTVEGFSEYKQAAIAVQKLNDGVANSMSDVEKTSTKAALGVKDLVKGFVGAKIVLTAFRKAADLVRAGLKFAVKDAALLTARVDVLGVVLETVGANADYTAAQMQEFEKAVKDNGITTQAARQSLVMMAQAEIDLAHAADLSRIAQDAAVIAGINSSEAFQRLTAIITSGNVRMARTLGLQVSFQRGYERLAKQLNTTTDALTEQQKVQARTSEVMRAGAGIAGAYEAAMGKVGKAMTSIPRYLEEIQLALGEAFQPALSALVEELAKRLAEVQVWLDSNETEIQELAASLGNLTEAMTDLVDELPGDDLKALIVDLTTLTSTLAAGITTVSEFRRENQKLVDTLQNLAQWTVFLGPSLALYAAKSLGPLVDGLTDARKEYDKLVAADREFRRWMEAERGESAMIARARERIEASEAIDGHMVVFLANQERLNRKMALTVSLSDQMEENIGKAAEALGKLQISLQRELADRLVALERERLTREIKAARAREDIARSNAQAVGDAYEQAAKAREDTAGDTAKAIVDFDRDAAHDREKLDLDYARTRIDIETATRRKLEDIQRNFEMSLQDAARSRDAFALVMAQRRAAKSREEALTGRQRQLEDAETEHGRQRADLQQSLAEQRADLQVSLGKRQQDIERQLQESLVAIEQQRQADLANLARRDAREREMEALQAQWEEQDRRTRLARQLEDMQRQYGVLFDVTAEGMLKQVEEWERAYGAEGAATKLVKDFSRTVREEASKMGQAMVGMANQFLDTMRQVSQVSLAPIPLPEEFQFQSPKLKLETGLRSLEKYLKTSPLTVMPGGAMPATKSSTFSRSETLARTEASHDVNVNMPDMDAVVARQMTNMFRQVLAA